MIIAAHRILIRSLALAGLALMLSACPESGGGSDPIAAANTVTVSGTVGGTRIVAMNDNDQIVVEDDTAGRSPSAPGRFPFTLANLPIGSNLRLFFVSNGSLFPFYLGGTNVFSFTSAGPVNLGFVTMNVGTGRSTPEFSPVNVTPQPENLNTPPGLIPGLAPTIAITSPSAGATVPVGPVTVAFSAQNHTIGNPGTSHLHFYLDTDTIAYHFYGGAGINEDNGVLYNGVHTHFVHWRSATTFDIFGLPSTTHTIRLVLADHNHNELANSEATITRNFSISQPPTGDLQLQSVLSGLSFPVGMALAPDGRVFFNERLTGRIRLINPQWQLVPTQFCQITIATNGEQGLLGLTLDPDFANNRFVYVYHTASSPLRNRVVRYTDSSGSCTQETIILDNLPASTNHNGGIIQFGPDGKLYVIIGDAENTANAQNVTSLAGKVLRVNPDGSAPSDNPFFSNTNTNAKKVYSLGHRNSYGFTFHGHTGHLWETENGPSDNDEINRVVSGGNYGWPTVRGIAGNANFRDPILAYVSVIAPTGIIAIPENSTVYPTAYRNNLLFTAWNDGRIRRVILSGPDLTLLGSSSTAYNGGQGGLLSLMLGADGFVYVSNTSSILRVVPQ
ncbi:MAG TPA: PQQ-dependent sugar dehydrogenase [Nitrospiraceae bacterium]|nr:PQQ-dependent sugar dehydrogenase [Nitrospiraceae bacterium]